ncbi:MAG TPA: hypothetical protein DCE48_13230 [Lachnospiraceae bacterium]|uniref:carbamoyltransferase N-terminal domain-containing protein n=1 Tax=Anaerosporobacter sp. TaxID=1872529 RepID=UPI000EE82B1F|nr:carbamoyltransferase N-terminal domain-containing protein [Anaerosporobacter sp.]HAB61632.1 hypothetical protein [Lachnospiraceae bacterium]
MYVLGLGGSNHDFSSCLLKDGEIQCMIEDERITRIKNCKGLGLDLAKGFSRKYCLDYMGIDIGSIDLIIGNDILNPIMYHRLDKEISLINHHMAHAASSFYTSPFGKAAILVVDAVGSKRWDGKTKSYESISIGYGDGNKIEILDKIEGKNLSGTDYIENSLGIFYSIITDAIGFGEHQEGKTMGLSPYGRDTYCEDFKKHIRYIGNGKIEMGESDISYFLSLKDRVNSCKCLEEAFSLKQDYAYAVQKVTEEYLLLLCKYVKEITNADYCCLAGGVALNSVSNYKIYKSGLFKDVYIQAASGDNGTSIGSALYGYYSILGNERKGKVC